MTARLGRNVKKYTFKLENASVSPKFAKKVPMISVKSVFHENSSKMLIFYENELSLKCFQMILRTFRGRENVRKSQKKLPPLGC